MTLTPQVIGRWIDRTGVLPRWKDSVIARAERGNLASSTITRTSILSPYPDVVKMIVKQLSTLRQVGVALNTSRCRGIIVGLLRHALPDIFTKKAHDGSMFKCSDSWVHTFLYDNLHYTMRKGTHAAQKLPANLHDVCREQFLRLALTIRDDVITSPEFLVNIDQTNIVYQPASGYTYEVIGSKQVDVVGQEEKRACTLLTGISAAGDLLPLQIVLVGKSKRSLPSVHAPAYDEALQMKFQFVFSKTDTYWSTFETMCMYVTDILVPFWMQKKEELGAPPDQPCILQLDCWVVHRSVAFRTWLDTMYNWIRYRFVPAGTTGVAQPCDVGLQRPIKLAIKELQHEDIVNETLMQLSSGTVPSEVRLDVTKGTLRDRSVRWFVEAYKAVNKTDLIKKVCFIFKLVYY
jgi:hypothetical protein